MLSPSIPTEVLRQGPTQFDMVGKRLDTPLIVTGEEISCGLVMRIKRYACARITDAGFQDLVNTWQISVYTIDGNDRPADRSYCVRWTNSKSGYIEVIGILTSKGWPSLDYGLAINAG